MNPAAPWLSVIIPVDARDPDVSACLSSLAACAEPGLEVILIGEVQDSARSVTKELPLLVSFIRQSGFSAGSARNLGALRAKGEVLFFTLPSCRVPPVLTARLKALFADAKLSAAGGSIRPAEPENQLSQLSAIEASYEQSGDGQASDPCPAMFCAAFRAEAFKSAGMCSEVPSPGQACDHGLCDRLMGAGGIIISDPELWVAQTLPRTWRETWRRQVRQGEARYGQLRAGWSLPGTAYLQPALFLTALGLLLFLGPRDPARAATLALLCLLLLYPANRSFLKHVAHQAPWLLKTGFLFCLLRPAAWVVGMLKGALGRLGLSAGQSGPGPA